MPYPVYFPLRTGQLLETLQKGQTEEHFQKALQAANKELEPQNVNVVFIQQLAPKKPEFLDPRYNLVLGIERTDKGFCASIRKLLRCCRPAQTPIDILDLKAIDEASLKSVDDLAHEIAAKARQHLAAEKTKGILLSASGSKIDARLLENHTVSIDNKGFLLVDGHRLATFIQERQKYWVLRAQVFRSYTITRWIEEEGGFVRVFDDYDLVRQNRKGMKIDLSKPLSLPNEELIEDARAEAANYTGHYWAVERDELDRETVEYLRKFLTQIDEP